jgi:8-oxo-dGTP pyrophosphatase MutT (NUDIX family)
MKPISIVEKTGFVNLMTRVAVQRDGKYLVVQENKQEVQGLWAFPGGKVDVGEFLIASAERELMEETGIRGTVTAVLSIRYSQWTNMPGVTLEVDFIAEAHEIPTEFPVSDEILSVEWKSLDELEQMRVEGKMRNPGQEAICTMLKSGHTLPISSVTEVHAPGPKF